MKVNVLCDSAGLWVPASATGVCSLSEPDRLLMGYDLYFANAPLLPEGGNYFRLSAQDMAVTRTAMRQLGLMRVAHRPRLPQPEEFGTDLARIRDRMAARGRLHPLAWPADGEQDAPERRWASALRSAYLAAELSGGPATRRLNRIPAYKLETNEGWWITPAELRCSVEAEQRKGRVPFIVAAEGGALVTLEPAEGAEPIGWWFNWVGWLMRGADEGGVLVF